MKSPKLLIQEDILDDTVLRRLGKVTPTGEKLPLQEIKYKPDKRIKQIKELPEEELAKAIQTWIKKENK